MRFFISVIVISVLLQKLFVRATRHAFIVLLLVLTQLFLVAFILLFILKVLLFFVLMVIYLLIKTSNAKFILEVAYIYQLFPTFIKVILIHFYILDEVHQYLQLIIDFFKQFQNIFISLLLNLSHIV